MHHLAINKVLIIENFRVTDVKLVIFFGTIVTI